MKHKPLETGIGILMQEFTISNNAWFHLSGYEGWQHEFASGIIMATLRLKYQCSPNFNYAYYPKSKNEIIIKADPLENPAKPNEGVMDRLGLEKFIGDIRRLKKDDDEIYFSISSNDTATEVKIHSTLMAINIPNILPYLRALIEDQKGSTAILTAIDNLAASYEHKQHDNSPKYNN